MRLNLRKEAQETPFEDWPRRYRIFVRYIPSDIRRYEEHQIEKILEEMFGGTFFDREGERLQFVYDNRGAAIMASNELTNYFTEWGVDGGWMLQREIETPGGTWYPEHDEHLKTEWNWEPPDPYIPDVEDLLFEEES